MPSLTQRHAACAAPAAPSRPGSSPLLRSAAHRRINSSSKHHLSRIHNVRSSSVLNASADNRCSHRHKPVVVCATGTQQAAAVQDVEADQVSTRSGVALISSQGVSAQDTFNAVAANMPALPDGALLGYGGRWERWQPITPPSPSGSPSGSPGSSRPASPSSPVASLTSFESIDIVDTTTPIGTSTTSSASAGAPITMCGPALASSPTSMSSAWYCWQLVSSGQCLYAFQPGVPPGQARDSAITVHVMEVGDKSPTLMADTRAGASQASGGADSMWSDVTRSTNAFRVDDVWFKPHLPDSSQPGPQAPTAGLRLWAANQHGFAMAPTHLPATLLHAAKDRTASTPAGAAGSATDGSEEGTSPTLQMPFIANLYVKHPSLEPGIGRRWGWNVQYQPIDQAPLQHIHHTSLGLLALPDVEHSMSPGGPRTTPPTAPGGNKLAPSIDAFFSQPDCQDLRGSAVEFVYDSSGQLQRRDIASCSWSSSPDHGSSRALELWYSSGSYTRVPGDLQSCLAAGRAVVIEAGAIIPGPDRQAGQAGPEDDSSPSGLRPDGQAGSRGAGGVKGAAVQGVTRWLLSYRPTDGQLEWARIEVYTV